MLSKHPKYLNSTFFPVLPSITSQTSTFFQVNCASYDQRRGNLETEDGAFQLLLTFLRKRLAINENHKLDHLKLQQGNPLEGILGGIMQKQKSIVPYIVRETC